MNEKMVQDYSIVASQAIQKIKGIIMEEGNRSLIQTIKTDGPYDNKNELNTLINLQNEGCQKIFAASMEK